MGVRLIIEDIKTIKAEAVGSIGAHPEYSQTLQRVAVEIEPLNEPAKPADTGDRLIDLSEVIWLTWGSPGQDQTNFPLPIEKEPRRWSRQAVLAWGRAYYPRRIDLDMAQGFIRTPYLCQEKTQ